MTGLPQGDSPLLLNCSYTITADIEVPEGGAEGMIADLRRPVRRLRLLSAQGQAGLSLEPLDLKRIKWQAPDALTPGKHVVEFDFKYDGLGAGTLASTTSAASAAAAPACSRWTAKNVAPAEDG